MILAAALEQNATTQDGKPITASTVYDGTSRHQVLDHGSRVGFAPPNEDDVDYGEITVQEAMNKSVNSVFAQMGVDVGMDKVMSTAGKLGMNTKGMQAVPAQTLGSMGASPLEMAGIYATFANHGYKVTPTIVKSAESKSRSVEMPNPVGGSVISRTAADTVTSVLTGVVDDGTAKKSVASNPLRDGQQVAGKTGTSDENKSAWFTGYTPDLVTSVGLFGEDPETKAHVSLRGATGLLPAAGPDQRRRLPGADLGRLHLRRHRQGHVRPEHHAGRGRRTDRDADVQPDPDPDAVADAVQRAADVEVADPDAVPDPVADALADTVADAVPDPHHRTADGPRHRGPARPRRRLRPVDRHT